MTTDIYTVLEIEGKIKVTLVGFFGPSGISALDNFRFAYQQLLMGRCGNSEQLGTLVKLSLVSFVFFLPYKLPSLALFV
jgi:hypothetical protein